MASGKSVAEFCAPMTALHAEIDFLLSQAEHVFLPFYLERKTGETALRRQYCYYTQYAPALFGHACATAPADARRVLTPLVHYRYGSLHTQLHTYRMLQSMGSPTSGLATWCGRINARVNSRPLPWSGSSGAIGRKPPARGASTWSCWDGLTR